MKAEGLDHGGIAELAETFRLLGDPSRLGIVLSCLHEPVSVGTLAERTALSPSLVSHHLRLLRTLRLVQAERRGRQMFYALPECHVRDMLTNMIEHVGERDQAGRPGKTKGQAA